MGVDVLELGGNDITYRAMVWLTKGMVGGPGHRGEQRDNLDLEESAASAITRTLALPDI